MGDPDQLSRRERQIMDVLYRMGRASAADVLAALPDPPSYSAVRALLRILEQKGHVVHEQDGPRYLYLPTVPREDARHDALRKLVETFFGGSTEGAMAALLRLEPDLDEDAIRRLERMIQKAREEGR